MADNINESFANFNQLIDNILDRSNGSPHLDSSSNATTPAKGNVQGEDSDSGLDSNKSALHSTIRWTDVTCASNLRSVGVSTPQSNAIKSEVQNTAAEPVSNMYKFHDKYILKKSEKSLRLNCKRRAQVDMTAERSATSVLTTDKSSMSGSMHKKLKRSLHFGNIDVFYFPRQQGCCCVPSSGGCTLGMAARHVDHKTMSLTEHAEELRRKHLKIGQSIKALVLSGDESSDTDAQTDESDDSDSDDYLPTFSPNQRRAILKAAGVQQIDAAERTECRKIRLSRQLCGCSCIKICDPETCTCSQSGIKCQVGRDIYRCGCTRQGCGNTIGRMEPNSSRVRKHIMDTINRENMKN